MELRGTVRLYLLLAAFGIALSVVGLGNWGVAEAADWPNWRGPDHNGISAETGWVAGKIKEGVKPLWETNIGTAFSSVAVSDGRLYTMGNNGALELVEEEEEVLVGEEEENGDEDEGDEEEGEEDEGEPEYYNRDYDAEAVAKGQFDIVYCLDALTGKDIWTYRYPALLEGKDYQGGPNATPTVDGNKVYTLSKRGKVFCFNAKTGEIIWQKDLRKEFEVKTPHWGLASSPLIIDNMVIYNAGSYGIALDKNDGSLVWQNGKGPAGYASAVPFSMGNQKCIAMLVHRELVGLAAATGKELWRVEWKTLYDENIPDVIISGDKLFASTGLGTGSALFKFDDSSLTKIWSNKKLQNHINSSVLWEGYIYGIDGAKLVCLDFETGRVAWSQKGVGKYGSSLTLSDGKLIILTEKGKLIIAEASPKGFKEISSAQILSGRCWTVPVLSNGKIYARSNGTGKLVCMDVSAEGTAAASGSANDWPQWHGPNRDAKSKEAGLLKSWPAGGPKMLWSVNGLGSGFSTVAIADGLIYLTGMIDKKGMLSAIDLQGNLKWQKLYGPEWRRDMPGVRSTPTVDGDYVYIMTGVGTVVCLDAKTGVTKWAVDVLDKFKCKPGSWGIAESLLIDGNNVICTPGGKKATVVALDKKTGKTIWASESLGEKSAYCSPILVKRGNKKLIVTMTAKSVVGIDAENGKVLWQDKFKDYQRRPKAINPVTPIYYDGCIYATSGYDDGGAMLKLSPDGTKVTRKWVDTALDCHHGGVVLVDGYIYGANWDGNEAGNWLCLDWDTGKVMYEKEWLGSKGSITYADGMLYCYEEGEGTVALVKASPKGFDIVSSFKVTKGEDEHWGHPVIYNGRLYIRHGDTLMAYNIKAK